MKDIPDILDKTKSSIDDTIKNAKETSTEAFVAIVGKPTVPSPKENKTSLGLSWINLTEEGVSNEGGELCTVLEEVKDTGSDVFDSNNIAEDIHGLADKLPTAGFYLDIIWPVTTDTVFPIEEHIALFGALQRLKSWHNAHLTVATIQNGYSWTIEPWLTYLRGEVKQMAKDCGSLLDWDLVWRGDVRFRDGKGVAAVPLPGVALTKIHREEPVLKLDETASCGGDDEEEEADSSSHNVLQYDDEIRELAAFERTLDVIHIVNLGDIPGCLVSSEKYNLDVTPGDRVPRTSSFFTWLVSEGRDHGMAVLTRLAGTRATHGALINNTGGGDAKLKTDQWKNNMHQVPNVEVKGHPYAMHLLLHGDETGKCVARVMHSPYEMNAAIHVQIASSQVDFDDDSRTSESTLQDLPVFDGTRLQEMEENISQLQREALKEFIDLRVSDGESATISLDELRELLSAVRKEYLAVQETKNVKTLKQIKDIQGLNLEHIKTELDQSPSEWLERLVIHHKESVEKKMKRYKSSDMMLGGMMVRKCKDNTIRLDAEEFLRHFKTDGRASALEEALSPVGVVEGSVLKDHSQQECDEEILKKDQPFEKLVEYKHADIRYCLDLQKTQKQDDHLLKMQQKLVWNETASTCTMEQAASPATMEIRSSKPKLQTAAGRGVKGQGKRRLSDSAKKRMMRGMKRKSDDAESSQANKRRLVRGDAVEEAFVKPTSTHKVMRKAHSLESRMPAAVRSSPRRQRLIKVASTPDEGGRRRASTSSVPSSSKVTMTTLDAAGRRRSSRGSSSSSGSTSTSQKSLASRKQKQKQNIEMLQGIVDELLKDKGITKDHAIYAECSKRLFNTTKEFIRSLPPNSYANLKEEMQSIAKDNVDFIVTFQKKIWAAKGK